MKNKLKKVSNEKKVKTNIYLENSFDSLSSIISKYKIKKRKVLLIIDKNVKRKVCKELIELFSINNSIFIYKDKSKEKNKNLISVNKLIQYLTLNDFNENDVIVSIGGGYIIDLAGFTASLYNRKLDLVIIPTTLSSMINSTIFYDYKINTLTDVNVMSLSITPLFIYENLNMIESLNYDSYIVGIASAIRLALIKDKKLYRFIEKKKEDIVNKNKNVIHYIINQTLKIKKYFYKLKIKNSKEFKIYDFANDIAYEIQKLEHLNYKYDYALALSIECILNINKFKNRDEVIALFEYFKFNMNYNKDIEKIYFSKFKETKKVPFVLITKIGKASINKYAIK